MINTKLERIRKIFETIKTKIKQKIGITLRILYAFSEDIFILSGLSVFVGTTFHVNTIAGWYLLGSILLMIGLFLSRKPPRKGV